MKLILSCLVSFALLFGYGCTSIRPQCTLSPITGQITCGVDIPIDQATGTSGTVTVTTGGKYLTREVDQCGNVRTVTRAVETCPQCANARALSGFQVNDVVSVYGRAFAPVGARGLASVSRAAVHRDLKREAHNASVLRSYSNDRSMWSSFKGHIFGVHDCLQPLEYAPVVEVVSGPQVGEIINDSPSLPTVDGLPPTGIIPPPDRAVSNLESRVGALEIRTNNIENKMDAMKTEILAAIAAVKPK